jgi:hypothetical protein
MGEASNFEIHNLAKHTLVRSDGAGCEEAVFWLTGLDAPLQNNFYTILRKIKLPFISSNWSRWCFAFPSIKKDTSVSHKKRKILRSILDHGWLHASAADAPSPSAARLVLRPP